VLVNYFARELRTRWRYDEFESGTMGQLCSLCVAVRPRAVRKKLFENLNRTIFQELKQKGVIGKAKPHR